MGIAFQSLKHEDVENIGYVIPTPVIMHFIQDYEKNGTYTGDSFFFLLRAYMVILYIVLLVPCLTLASCHLQMIH